MGKQIRIDAEFFGALIKYFWSEDFPTGWLADEIRRGYPPQRYCRHR